MEIQNEKYLKKAPYWFDGKQYRDTKVFSNAAAQGVANKINQNYSSINAKVVDIEEGEAWKEMLKSSVVRYGW